MNPSEKTPKELVILADAQYRAMQYQIATALLAEATAKALVAILEILEAQKEAVAPKETFEDTEYEDHHLIIPDFKAPKAKRAKKA